MTAARPYGGPRPRRLSERFWEKVDKSGDCWIWTGRRSGSMGYGRFNVDRETALVAHRVAYILATGPIPSGMLLCHSCDNPPCVNPAHLFIGTAKDNHDDMRAKRRENYLIGERHQHALLTNDQVKSLRQRYQSRESSLDELVAEYGLRRRTIQQILRGKRYQEVV